MPILPEKKREREKEKKEEADEKKEKKSAQKDSLGNSGSPCGGSWASYPWIRWRDHPCNWKASRQERHKGRIAKGRVGSWHKEKGWTYFRMAYCTVRATVLSVFVMEMDWVAGTPFAAAKSWDPHA